MGGVQSYCVGGTVVTGSLSQEGVCVWGVDFKELAQMIMETGQSKIPG